MCDFQEGIQNAFNVLYNRYIESIENHAKRKSVDGDIFTAEALLEEMQLSFLKSVEKYEVGGVKFKTFMWTCVQNSVQKYYTYLTTQKRSNGYKEISLNEYIDDEENSLQEVIADDRNEEKFLQVEFKQILDDEILPNLERIDKKIICYLAQGYKVSQVAEKLHITRTWLYVRIKRLSEMDIWENMIMNEGK